MKYFFPDSQDFVDPSFDFERETRAVDRVRHRDDLYAHEVFEHEPYHGMLVSKGIVDGSPSGGSGRYSMAQRHRLLRVGAPTFFRLNRENKRRIELMGDCGAFTYVKEETPPYTVDEVLEFYESCKFDYGISIDHVILGYDASLDARGRKKDIPQEYAERQQLTLALASDFFRTHSKERLGFVPIGVAQGWSPRSYAHAVKKLQKIGFRYIALGGMVPLKTSEILAALEEIATVKRPDTRLHLLGITRLDWLSKFREQGVVSFDSTSPLRQAFKDEKDNYYTMERAYPAIRVPQIDGNTTLQKKIRSGQIPQDEARRLEKSCLESLRKYQQGKRINRTKLVSLIVEYEQLLGSRKDRSAAYLDVLATRPWASCTCTICRKIGHHVILFRGAERNRRRGFHNTWIFYQRLRGEIAP